MTALRTRIGIAVFACVAFAVPMAYASPITVGNPSFEILPVGGLSGSCNGTGCIYSVAAIPDWSNSGQSGQFQPGTQDGNFIEFTTLSDGITSAYTNNGTISQTVGATVQVGAIYTLSVGLGWRNDAPSFASSADLLIDGTQYFATGTAVQGAFTTFTATYTGLAADANDSITIQLNNSGGPQANFDNVQLSEVSAPEPAFTGAVGIALFGLAAFRRRKRCQG